MICLQPLLSEGLQRILLQRQDIELVQPAYSDLLQIEHLLSLGRPDLIVVAGEQEDQETERLISMLLSHCEEVPIIWIGLDDSFLHVYSSRILPASSAGLIDLIQQVPVRQAGRKNIPPTSTGGDTDAI